MPDPKLPTKGFKGFVNRNVVLIVMIPFLFSVHYGWSVLQNNPKLVHPSEKKNPWDIVKKIAAEKWEAYSQPVKEDP